MNAQNHSNNNVINLLLVVFGKITGEKVMCISER